MNGLKRIWPYLMACTLVVIVPARQGLAQQNSGASKPSVQYAPADRALILRSSRPSAQQVSSKA